MPMTPEERKAYNKAYQQKNKEKIKEQRKEYLEKNKEHIKEQDRKRVKEYREKNKEHIKEQDRKRGKEYREKNKEKKKEYYEKNKEQIKEKLKEYREKNKEKLKESRQTEPVKKSKRITNWKISGLKSDDFDSLHEYYLNCKNCEHCNIELVQGRYGANKKCLDHSHTTGLFRNVLCNTCNTKRRENNILK